MQKVLSDEYASDIRSRMRSSFATRITTLVEQARSNAEQRPAEAEFFRGVVAGLNHSMFIFYNSVDEELF
jgi:hypothetical protein